MYGLKVSWFGFVYTNYKFLNNILIRVLYFLNVWHTSPALSQFSAYELQYTVCVYGMSWPSSVTRYEGNKYRTRRATLQNSDGAKLWRHCWNPGGLRSAKCLQRSLARRSIRQSLRFKEIDNIRVIYPSAGIRMRKLLVFCKILLVDE